MPLCQKTWVQVRKQLEENESNYITYEQFLEICKQSGFEKLRDSIQLSQYLHDIGVILHFQDHDVLKHTVILKPEWGTDAVYKALDAKIVMENNGKFTNADLRKIWPQEKYQGKHRELLELMMKFQLCYRLPNTQDEYILPQLLDFASRDYTWETKENLIVRYEFDFLLPAIMTRFIVTNHQRIAGDGTQAWRNGAIFEKRGAQARVLEYTDQRYIEIQAKGPFARDLVVVLTESMNNVLNYYPKLKYEVLVPCICTTCQKSADPHRFRMSQLQNFIEHGTEVIHCGNPPGETVNIWQLLDSSVGRFRLLDTNEYDSIKGNREAGVRISRVEKLVLTSGERNVIADQIESRMIVTGDENKVEQAFKQIHMVVEDMLNGPEKVITEQAVKGLEQEAQQGEKASESNIRKWLDFLVGTAPDAWEVAVNTFINPAYGFSSVMQKVAKRAKEEREKK